MSRIMHPSSAGASLVLFAAMLVLLACSAVASNGNGHGHGNGHGNNNGNGNGAKHKLGPIMSDGLRCKDFSLKGKVGVSPYDNPDVGFGSVFQNMTTHTAWVVKTQEEYDYLINSFSRRAGIGPWRQPQAIRNQTATYCGETVVFNVNITLTESRAQGYGFHEIFRLVDESPSFFRDWYEQHGISMPYHGLELKVNPATGNYIMTSDEFEAYTETYRTPVIFHFNAFPKDARFFRIGYSFAEAVLPSAGA